MVEASSEVTIADEGVRSVKVHAVATLGCAERCKVADGRGVVSTDRLGGECIMRAQRGE